MDEILVTGATGFLGRRVIRELAAHGHGVLAVYRRTPGPGLPGVRWVHADLLKPDSVERLFSAIRPSALVHLAWREVHGDVVTSWENMKWLRASLALAEAFVESGGTRIVGCGTCYEYDVAAGTCHEVLTPIAPATLYGHSKHALNVALAGLAAHAGIGYAWARLFFAYGSGEHPDRFVSSLIYRMLDGAVAPMSHGRQIRDYLHVDDIAAAFRSLVESQAEGVFNIGEGKGRSLAEIAGEIARQLGTEHLLDRGAIRARAHEPRILVADCRKIAMHTGWRPQVPLAEGIAETIASLRESVSPATKSASARGVELPLPIEDVMSPNRVRRRSSR